MLAVKRAGTLELLGLDGAQGILHRYAARGSSRTHSYGKGGRNTINEGENTNTNFEMVNWMHSHAK